MPWICTATAGIKPTAASKCSPIFQHICKTYKGLSKIMTMKLDISQLWQWVVDSREKIRTLLILCQSSSMLAGCLTRCLCGVQQEPTGRYHHDCTSGTKSCTDDTEKWMDCKLCWMSSPKNLPFLVIFLWRPFLSFLRLPSFLLTEPAKDFGMHTELA